MQDYSCQNLGLRFDLDPQPCCYMSWCVLYNAIPTALPDANWDALPRYVHLSLPWDIVCILNLAGSAFGSLASCKHSNACHLKCHEVAALHRPLGFAAGMRKAFSVSLQLHCMLYCQASQHLLCRDLTTREVVFASVAGLRGSVSLIMAQAFVTESATSTPEARVCICQRTESFSVHKGCCEAFSTASVPYPDLPVCDPAQRCDCCHKLHLCASSAWLNRHLQHSRCTCHD